MSAEDVLMHATIFDRIRFGNAQIKWEFCSPERLAGTTISSASVTGVFCYSMQLIGVINQFAVGDRDYAAAEARAYLGFAVAQFGNVINVPFAGALSGFTDTLLSQWHTVSAHGILQTPSHDIGGPELLSPRTVLTDNLWDYGNWSVSRNRPQRKDGHKFRLPEIYLRYELPEGDPVIVWFVDDYMVAFHARTCRTLDLAFDERCSLAETIALFHH